MYLTFETGDEILNWNQTKPVELYFLRCCLLWFLHFESKDKFVKCSHSEESLWASPLCSAVSYPLRGGFNSLSLRVNLWTVAIQKKLTTEGYLAVALFVYKVSNFLGEKIWQRRLKRSRVNPLLYHFLTKRNSQYSSTLDNMVHTSVHQVLFQFCVLNNFSEEEWNFPTISFM